MGRRRKSCRNFIGCLLKILHVRKGILMTPVYEVGPISGKGIGMVATADVKAGQIIIEESALLTLNLSKDGDLVGRFIDGEFISVELTTTLKSLPDKDLICFYSLCDSYTEAKKGKSNYGIIKTNSFCIKWPQPESDFRLALFPTIARINHDCQPNCHHYWNLAKKTFSIRAVRDVKSGEELTISYMSPLTRTNFCTNLNRRQVLLEEFGFDCNCDECSKETDEAGQDRVEIQNIEQQWCNLGNEPDKAIRLAKQQLELCRRRDFHAGHLSYVIIHSLEAITLKYSKLFEERPLSESELENFHMDISKLADELIIQSVKAYGSISEEATVFQGIYKTCKSKNDPESIYCEIQSGISKLIESDSVP